MTELFSPVGWHTLSTFCTDLTPGEANRFGYCEA